ncbi:MAG: hypothetical protein NXI12_03265 [Alphaproteobacteria bacterium]|nr:hypothetical protein [Alphaproteobacteria bacterium]
MLVRLFLPAACGFALSACATTGPERHIAPVHPEAAALAELLVATGRTEPARIDAARAEMAALNEALLRRPEAEAAPVEPQNSQAVNAEPGPMPDLDGARSVMSAVHLASYRIADRAGSGWRELQAEHPALLSGLEARLAPVELGERGVFLRLKAGPLDSPDAARALCARFEAAGAWCAPSDFNGERLR